MPIYEYYCHGCKKKLEILQKISESIKKKCPQCSGKLEKLISETAFQLKGTGWYKTDYASKPSPKEESKPAKTSDSSPSPKAPAQDKTNKQSSSSESKK